MSKSSEAEKAISSDLAPKEGGNIVKLAQLQSSSQNTTANGE